MIKIKKYKHLNFPETWEHYWTKYPEGYTVLEALIEWVSQVNDMVDSQNKLTDKIEKFTKEIRDELDDFKNRFSSDLYEKVEEILEYWQSEGILEVIISEVLENEIKEIKTFTDFEIDPNRKKKGHVVFISDDGHKGDWETLKPIFESQGAPFCVAIVTDWMKPSHPYNGTRMSWEQVKTLQDDLGCEVMSHYTTHTDPRPTEHNDHELHLNLKESKDILLSKGLNVQSFRVPGNNMGVRERNAIKEYFRATVVSDAGDTGLNIQPYETHELKSIWIDNESYGGAKEFSYYKEHIDRANEEGAILIISMHGYALEGVTDVIEQTLNYANSNSNVTTLRQALNESGNIIEIGDYTRTRRSDREPDNYFVIGSDGVVAGGMFVSKPNEYSVTNKWYDFPNAYTVCAITSDHPDIDKFPGGIRGVLENIKPTNTGSYSYQKYRHVRSKREYYRYLSSDGENYGDWKLNTPGVYFNDDVDYNFNHGPSSYERGITFNEVTSRNQDIDQAPEKRSGVRITYKSIGGTTSQRYNYQEYIVADKGSRYIRYAQSDSEWGDWVDETSHTNIDNTLDISQGISNYKLGLTMTRVSASDTNIGDMPSENSGLLLTYNVTGEQPWGVNHQEFHANISTSSLIVYKRRPRDSDSWNDWVQVSNN